MSGHQYQLVLIDAGTNATTVDASGGSLRFNVVAQSLSEPQRNLIPPRYRLSKSREPGGATAGGTLRGMIEGLALVVNSSTSIFPSRVDVRVFGSDDFADDAAPKILGQEKFEGSTDFTQELNGTTYVYVAAINDLEIPYKDFDLSGEFHIEVVNRRTTAIEPGELRLQFHYRPETQR